MSEKINVLKAHRDNIANATNLGEYKEAHIRFINFLIKKQESQDAEEQATIDFLYPTETITRTTDEA